MAHSGTNPSPPPHDEFGELCALAAIGELSAEEFHELQAHLGECGACRAVYADFTRIATRDVGLLAGATLADGAMPEPIDVPDTERVLSRILAQAPRKGLVEFPKPVSTNWRMPRLAVWQIVRQPAGAWAAAIVIALLAGVSGYRLAASGTARVTAELEAARAAQLRHAELTVAGERAAAQAADADRKRHEQLQSELAESQTRYGELSRQQEAQQAALADATKRFDVLKQELQGARAESDQQSKLREQVQARLQAALAEVERTKLAQQQTFQKLMEQERTVADLRSQVRKAETVAAASEEGVVPAQLFGARDLHIVDVYDVDSSGKTQRTYGRVYFAEKKLLVFYAFDLQDKRRNRTAAGFQAWGYREPNDAKPENLGLFYVDDPAVNRWVLKVDNAAILQRIDAVYVTLEPPGGSPAPRGRKLLYASLAGAPNHP